MSPWALGMDIGGTHVRIGLVSPEGRLEHFKMAASAPLLNTADPLGRLEELMRQFMEEHGVQPACAAVGFPSTVDARREVVISTPNIASLQQLPVTAVLSRKLGFPVYVNRDVNLILLSDLDELKLDPAPETVCGFYIGTGLGNTIMINGRLLVGSRGVAAELGHMHVPGFDGTCGCGGQGCIELLCGGLALNRIRQEYYPQTPIGEMFVRHAGTKPLQRYIRNLAGAVAGELVLIDPEVSIFGGGVLQMKGFPRQYFEECIYSYARRPCPAGSLKFIYVKDSQHSGVRGAGLYAFRRLSDPTYL